MLCPSCGADLPDDSYYCAECGAQLDEKAFNAQYAAPATSGSSSGHSSSGYSDSYDSEPLSLTDALFRPFKDPDWMRKVLIAAAFGIIPFFGQLVGMVLVMGFEVDYIRKILNRDRPQIMPDWLDWSGLLTSGIMLWLIQAIYGMAVYFVCGISFLPFFGAIAAMWEQLQGPNPDAALGVVFTTLSIPILVSTIVLSIFSMYAFLIPIFYARNKQFGDAFQFAPIFRMIMADMGNFVMITLALFGIALGAGLIVMIPMILLFVVLSFLPVVGQIIASFISGIISMALMFVMTMMTASVFSEFYIKNRNIAEM